MKKSIWLILLAFVLVFTGCKGATDQVTYTLAVVPGAQTTYEVGTDKSAVDFTRYFAIKGSDGSNVTVTADMLDLSKVDFSTPGTFEVTLTYAGKDVTLIFTVKEKGATPDPDPDPVDLSALFARYADMDSWNFYVNYKMSDGTDSDEVSYAYMGQCIKFTLPDEEGNLYTDYLWYDAETDDWKYYSDVGGAVYEVYSEKDDADSFQYYVSYYISYFDLSELQKLTAPESGTQMPDGSVKYVFPDAQKAGESIFDEYEGDQWADVAIYVKDDRIVRVTAELDTPEYDSETYEPTGNTLHYSYDLTFTGFGTVSFDVSGLEMYVPEPVVLPDDYMGLWQDAAKTVTLLINRDSTVLINGFEGVDLIDLTALYGGYYVTAGDVEWLFGMDEENNLLLFDLTNDGEYSLTRAAEACDHSWDTGRVTVAATCAANGTRVLSCTKCGATKNEVIPATGNHNPGAAWKYDESNHWHLCTVCGNPVGTEAHTYVSGKCKCGREESAVTDPADLAAILAKYTDIDRWNFKLTFAISIGGYAQDSILYGCLGDDCYVIYSGSPDFTDYVIYDAANDTYYYYSEAEDGTYYLAKETDEDFANYVAYIDYFDFTTLAGFTFTSGGKADDGSLIWIAADPQTAGAGVLDAYEGETYSSFKVYTKDGVIVRIVAVSLVSDATYGDATYEYTLTFADYGSVSFDVSKLVLNNGGTDPDPTPEPTPSSNSTVFTDQYLGSASGSPKYETTAKANSFDSGRGVQYLQNGGEVIITSVSSFNGITSVTLVVQTNSDTGMTVSVWVGGTQLTCKTAGGKVSKTDYNVLTTLEFTSATALTGKVKIVMTPSGSSKSMYISSVTLNASGTTDPDPTPTPSGNVMEKQDYDKSTADDSRLNDQIKAWSERNGYDPAIGLPSTGTYNCLVIPVQFPGALITAADLARLKIAFNGTADQTGWESVKTYYEKSSYGKLNLTFDILNPFTPKYAASYYEQYRGSTSYGYEFDGSQALLMEALAYYDGSIDFSKYDTNGDGCIDAVYLIYSNPVDYTDADFWWAYVTTASLEDTDEGFDEVFPYYYLFAGLDFMCEKVRGEDKSGSDFLYDGLLINAETYIHETGHLLGLDDYYDYDGSRGANVGLGGASMMDMNIGDIDAYSKLMLGWVTPVVVNADQTINLNPFVSSGEVIMLLLDYDGTYFSEYLLIDFYTCTGLNQFHGERDDAMFGGAAYGVRIYHVSASCKNPFSNDSGSFTDNDNSYTAIPLIKYVEADGTTRHTKTGNTVVADDLWQTGDAFGSIYPKYTRNDGKYLNFNIVIVSTAASGATIQVTFS